LEKFLAVEKIMHSPQSFCLYSENLGVTSAFFSCVCCRFQQILVGQNYHFSDYSLEIYASNIGTKEFAKHYGLIIEISKFKSIIWNNFPLWSNLMIKMIEY
jgi:hypothetical protein